MTRIPRDPMFDGTLFLLKDGYDFIWKRCRRWQTDLFRTRILGKPAVCIHGREAAELFYDESRLERHGAIPPTVVATLFGRNAVHTLDDAAHRHRKAAFMELMQPSSLERLMNCTTERWRTAARRWEREGTVTLFVEAQRLLAGAICDWAGVPIHAEDLPKLAHDLYLMVDAFGGAGPRLLKGKLARIRSERWLAGIVGDVRRGALSANPGTALHIMSHHRDLNGELLSPKTAAVELLNVLRPTVAISWYITFAALALHEHPEAREQIAREPIGDAAGEYADLFMQEVRRFYPFTPFLGARVRRPFEWKGLAFEPGTLVLLDVYGTDHDPRLWDGPDEFRPERFQRWNGDAYAFIPQGGGSHRAGHRCPGEWITMHNMVLALHFLTRCMNYEVAPGQDLRFSLRRMPTRPRSGLILRNVKTLPALDAEAPRLPSRMAATRNGARVVPMRTAAPRH